MDSRLKSNLEWIKKILRDDYDFVLVICGKEGVGKSDLGLQICKYIDPTFNVDRICWGSIDFLQQIYKGKKYSAIQLDEGIESLFTRRAMSSENVAVVKELTQTRHRNLFLLVCIPDLLLLESYMRRHRTGALIRLISRGRFAFYSAKRVKKIRRDKGSQVIKWPMPNFFGRCNSMSGKRLWKEYKAKKSKLADASNSKKVFAEREKLIKKAKGTYTLRDISIMTNISHKSIQRFFYNYTLFPKRQSLVDIFGRRVIKPKGYKTFLKRLAHARKVGFKRYERPKKLKTPKKAKRKRKPKRKVKRKRKMSI